MDKEKIDKGGASVREGDKQREGVCLLFNHLFIMCG